jgi:hypothetical protein
MAPALFSLFGKKNGPKSCSPKMPSPTVTDVKCVCLEETVLWVHSSTHISAHTGITRRVTRDFSVHLREYNTHFLYTYLVEVNKICNAHRTPCTRLFRHHATL